MVLDELKVKENLVYDQHEEEVVGFVSMNDLDNQLAQFERDCCADVQHPTIASHMLVLMVRGIFTSLRFPYAHFATHRLQGHSVVWEAVEHLEYRGFKVLAVTADGGSCNLKFFRLHCGAGDTYREVQ